MFFKQKDVTNGVHLSCMMEKSCIVHMVCSNGVQFTGTCLIILRLIGVK